MHRYLYSFFFLLVTVCGVSSAENWPQGAGPALNYAVSDAVIPTVWSVVDNRNIVWRKTLPETGQSTVVVWDESLFFTTMVPVEADSEMGTDIVAYRVDAKTGETLWKREIHGTTPSRMSGCFGDSTTPAAVTDGESVVFLNGSGTIRCFDFSGEEKWSRNAPIHVRAQPFLVNGTVIFHRAHEATPKEKSKPKKSRQDSRKDEFNPLKWNQLQALDLKTGEVRWTTACGTGIGCIPTYRSLPDGRSVVLVGRGGGHHPIETPHGISLIDAADGKVLWTLPLGGFQTTLTMSMDDRYAYVFHKGEHFAVDLKTSEVAIRHSIVRNVKVCRPTSAGHATGTEDFPVSKKRAVTQQSNLLVGEYHFFRRYQSDLVGRIHIRTGVVEYLEMPIKPVVNEMTNSRGFVVMGDPRSRKNNWGHHASPIATAAGSVLLLPVMDGTVHVFDSDTDVFNQESLLSVNDLGPTGKAWTRASVSVSSGRLYAHTIREIICIGESK